MELTEAGILVRKVLVFVFQLAKRVNETSQQCERHNSEQQFLKQQTSRAKGQ
jgi:hypothetical protein